MLFSLGHGQHIVPDPAPASPPDIDAPSPAARGAAPRSKPKQRGDAVPLAAIGSAAPLTAAIGSAPQAPSPRGFAERQAPYAGPTLTLALPTKKGAFRYLFRNAPESPATPEVLAALDALADSMVEPAGDPATDPAGQPVNSTIPPVFTYLGQFIDHDITANTDRDGGLSLIDDDCAPQPRVAVEEKLDNLREGSLGLDSLYGDSAGQGAFSNRLAGLMRHPRFRAKMRLGVPDRTTPQPPLPQDGATGPAADLLRLGFLLDRGDLSLAELQALPDDLRAAFLEPDGSPKRAHAIIGDDRNDENLIVAQLHVAFLRLHNSFADQQASTSYEAARRLTRYHYQWLVVNEYLPAVCDPAVLAQVVADGAPVYRAFHAANPPEDPAKLPLPLEFSVAGFRFGHSMVRGIYDYNRFFGTPVPGADNVLPEAAFNLLFGFTGGGGMRPFPGADKGSALPSNWIIEWERFLHQGNEKRMARKIDTRLAPPLKDMFKEAAGIFRHLAQRNLRRGHRLNLPSAQACIAGLNAQRCYAPVPVLAPDVVAEGRDFLRAPGLDAQTPLWFYILREAELAGGNHLGALGSHIVAETLLGLIVADPGSYYNDIGAGHRWTPQDARPEAPITSLEEMLRFVGML